MQTQQIPNEFLFRWDDEGNPQGAHIVWLIKVTDDNGSVLSAQLTPPAAIALGEQSGFPLQDVLSQLQIDALKQIEELQAEKRSLESEITASTEQIEGLNSQLEISQSTIGRLEAEKAALQTQLDELLNSPIAENGLTPEEIAQFRELLQRLS